MQTRSGVEQRQVSERPNVVASLAPGTVFAARYRIIDSLGSGGMGHVYRAEHIALSKPVALKILGKPLPDSETRFHREARAIARLAHPSCVRILDYAHVANRYQYIAMELLDGPTLAAVLFADFRLEPPRALAIARQLLGALAHAHASGVLHRDVKPENVMLVTRATGQRAVLIDFGLARLDDDASLTADGMCLGSPSYIAPERLLGKPYDARCDLYAVGVILYEMLAGARPFVGASPKEVMDKSLSRPPRPLRAICRDISPALDAFVMRALAKDPARRFADAEDMLSELDALSKIDDAPPPELSSSATFTDLTIAKPSWFGRAWGWIRYGRWRWHHHEHSEDLR
jgi:eukaryotic-like serine/threonine-protein kinase